MDAAEEQARDLIQDWYNRGVTDTPLVYLVSGIAQVIRAERTRCIQAAQEVVTHILSTTVVSRSDPGYDGGKRVGASDVLSALVNLD